MNPSSRIAEIQAEIQDARIELQQSLVAGYDTAPIRERINELEAEIEAHRTAEKQEAAAARAAEQVEVAETAAAVAEQAQAAVETAVEVPGLAELAGELEPLPQDPQLAYLGRAVATAEAALTKARAAHAPNAEKVRKLSDRIATLQADVRAIQVRRAGGDTRTRDAAELELLQADISLLQEMAGAAQVEAAATKSAVDAAENALRSARAELARHQARAAFDASMARLQKAEEVFVAAFRSMAIAGRQIGLGSPWSEYRPSADMKRAVTGQFVAGTRDPFFRT